jgi:hypothetical protein
MILIRRKSSLINRERSETISNIMLIVDRQKSNKFGHQNSRKRVILTLFSARAVVLEPFARRIGILYPLISDSF